MKTKFFLAIPAVCFLLACNSNSTSEKEKPADKKTEVQESNKGNGDNLISFKVNGEDVTSSGWAISRFDFGGGMSVNVTSNMHLEPRTINVNINGETPGTYPFKRGMGITKTRGIAYGSYSPDYMKQIGNHFTFEDGEFTITSIDTTAGLLNASFHGNAINMKGETVTITDGKVVNGNLKSRIGKMTN